MYVKNCILKLIILRRSFFMLTEIIILGSTGGCLDLVDLIIDINKESQKYKIVGFLDDKHPGEEVVGYKVLGGFEDWVKFKNVKYVTAIGSETNYYKRDEIINSIPEMLYETLIHPTAIISKHCIISNYGVIIHAHVKIGTNAVINKFALILNSSIINHDCKISEFTIINSGCNLSGGVEIHEKCYIGASCIILNNKIIGANSLVGAGSLITKNVDENDLVYGFPAIKRKKKLNL